jgi:mono/diheme cytochrome c family protein
VRIAAPVAVVAVVAAVVAAVIAGSLAMAGAVADSAQLAKPYSNYLLGCGGCHGIDGVSNARLVPQLRGQVGYFLATRTGREYLVRVPNVAFYTASNDELAQMLNYMVFTIGREGVPANAKPYTAAEVAKLRKSPLNEVSLIDYRNRLVEDLIVNHGAPSSLRLYSSGESY